MLTLFDPKTIQSKRYSLAGGRVFVNSNEMSRLWNHIKSSSISGSRKRVPFGEWNESFKAFYTFHCDLNEGFPMWRISFDPRESYALFEEIYGCEKKVVKVKRDFGLKSASLLEGRRNKKLIREREEAKKMLEIEQEKENIV